MDRTTSKHIHINTPKKITDDELDNMPWSNKCELISKDPATCA